MDLITIPMSHYCEKVRWALQRMNIDYRELGHLQGLHYPHAYWHGGGPFVPVLCTPQGAIADSTAILRWLDRDRHALYPTDLPEVPALEDRYDEVLGVETRRWIYSVSLTNPDFIRFAAHGTPAWERLVFRGIYPFVKGFLARRLTITDAAISAGLVQIEQILVDAEERLATGSRYLVGDQFTAADLTFACMLAPLVLPRRYGIPMPSLDAMNQPLIHRTRARPAGQFALRMFCEERPTPPWMNDTNPDRPRRA